MIATERTLVGWGARAVGAGCVASTVNSCVLLVALAIAIGEYYENTTMHHTAHLFLEVHADILSATLIVQIVLSEL